jgi:1-acyl-sn-glycerol-3-phosphate acyltransferase
MTLIQPPPGQRPPDIPLPVYWLASAIAWVFGWKYGGGLPNYPKMVICAGPHTSNWDGFWYLVMTARMRLRSHVIIKAELVGVPIVGWVFRMFGGIPVDRRSSQNLVDQLVTQFEKRDTLALVIAPEGTRRRTEYWRAGFYWIAYRAGVPIVVAALNYKTKTLGFYGIINPSGDIHADMKVIAKIYAEHGLGRNPEYFGPVRVRSDRRPDGGEAGAASEE